MNNEYHIALQPDRIYHLFNCAVGNEKFFLNEDNYHYYNAIISDGETSR